MAIGKALRKIIDQTPKAELWCRRITPSASPPSVARARERRASHNQEVLMAASNPDHGSEPMSSPTSSSPDELIKDLELEVSKDEESSVVGGRKAGKGQQEFLIVKMNDTTITGG